MQPVVQPVVNWYDNHQYLNIPTVYTSRVGSMTLCGYRIFGRVLVLTKFTSLHDPHFWWNLYRSRIQTSEDFQGVYPWKTPMNNPERLSK